jgi:predicted dehydrogenase
MMLYDDMQPSEKLLIYDKGVTIAPWSDREQIYSQLVSYRSGDMQAPKVDDREALAVETDHIIDCIRSGRRPTTDGESGARVVRILDAAERSIRAHSHPVTLEGGTVAPLREPVAFPIVPAGRIEADGRIEEPARWS